MDLLAVFDDNKKVVILLIEAKGVGSIDTKQLARKLTRAKHILAASRTCRDATGAAASGHSELICRFVWVAPKRGAPQSAATLWGYGRRCKSPELAGFIPDETCTEGIGHENPIPYVPLQGFPEKVWKVTRTDPIDASHKEFARWKIEERRPAKE